jgi:hypothetical protein
MGTNPVLWLRPEDEALLAVPAAFRAVKRMVDLEGFEPPTRGLANHRSRRLHHQPCGLATPPELQAHRKGQRSRLASETRWPLHFDLFLLPLAFFNYT